MDPGQLAATLAPLPTQPELSQLLPGNWQLQIYYPNGMIEQAGAQFAGGQFIAQGSAHAGGFEIQGTWQVDPSNQLYLAGQQTDGFKVQPYSAIVQFSMATAQPAERCEHRRAAHLHPAWLSR